MLAEESKLSALESMQPKYSQLPSSTLAVASKLSALESVQPKYSQYHHLNWR